MNQEEIKKNIEELRLKQKARERANAEALEATSSTDASRQAEQIEMFVATLVDVNPKDDQQSMQHPMFAITKRKDMAHREFTDGRGRKTRISPSAKGLATIWDKDLLLFAISQIAAARDRGLPAGRNVRMLSIDMLRLTRRGDGSKSYRAVRDSLDRLRGTQISTEIETGGKRVTRAFGWIDGYEIISDRDGKVYEFSLTLPEWVFDAILGEEILAISSDYFDLEGGLERRLYEIGRKHLGRQRSWRCSMTRLHEKSGSTAPLKRFRFELKKIVESQPLPGLHMALTENDIVLFTPVATE